MPTRILIVEDSPTQAEALRELLEGAGYAVGVATSGQEGLERFEAAPPDIVVSDIVMPGGVDGYELCRRIKMGEHNGTPVVLLTSLSDPMDIIHGLECGADNFLTKPYDPGHLLDRLQLLLATRRARKRDRVRAGVKLIFMGREFTISSEREQILDLLVTTFEEAVRQNHDLRQREEELTAAQTQLARYARSLEAQLESILSSVPDVLFSVTPDGAEVRYVSPAVSHVFGCTPEAFTLEYWREHVHADDRDKAWSAFLHAVESKTAQAVEYRYSIRPGETNWILEHFVPAMNGVPRVDGIARDVTERKEAERALRESEEALRAHRAFLRQVIDADPNLLFVKDWDGRFTLANKAVAAIYGTTPEQLTGKTDADFNPNREEVEHFLRDDRGVMTSLRPKLIAEEAVTIPEAGATRWFYTVKV
ncbi:MAG: response regulator, partial [Gemmatimonadetes bacterium]|nr:response regulator [Gemmatimonadota bacterium]